MTIDEMIDRIRALEDEINQTIDKKRQQFNYQVQQKRVRFEQAAKTHHRQLKTGIFRYLIASGFLSVLFAPVVYMLIFPLVILDVFVTIYQFVCFPIYGIEPVKRAHFIAIDRHQLGYLNLIQKFNCIYCGYANGLLAYAREIAGRSEEHWCPIKHARRIKGQHRGYWSFAEFGDADGLISKETEITNKSDTRRGKDWTEHSGDN